MTPVIPVTPVKVALRRMVESGGKHVFVVEGEPAGAAVMVAELVGEVVGVVVGDVPGGDIVPGDVIVLPLGTANDFSALGCSTAPPLLDPLEPPEPLLPDPDEPLPLLEPPVAAGWTSTLVTGEVAEYP